jgi:hypothetical protein
MFMFVLAFHDRLPLKNSQFLTKPAPDGGFQVRRVGGVKEQLPAIDFHQAWKPSLDLQACLSHLVDINGCEFHCPLVGDQTVKLNHTLLRFGLQPRVDMPGPTAFRGIASDIEKLGFLVAAGTLLRRFRRREGIAAIAATPVCQVALRADIPHEPP